MSLLAIPIRLGDLSIADPQAILNSKFAASEKVTSPLVMVILQRKMFFSCNVVDAQHRAKSVVVASKCQAMEEMAASVCNSISSES